MLDFTFHKFPFYEIFGKPENLTPQIVFSISKKSSTSVGRIMSEKWRWFCTFLWENWFWEKRKTKLNITFLPNYRFMNTMQLTEMFSKSESAKNFTYRQIQCSVCAYIWRLAKWKGRPRLNRDLSVMLWISLTHFNNNL
jgi:hypothetical protein